MGSFSDYSENALMNHVFGSAYTPPAGVYLALSTADPTEDGTGMAEPADVYARTQITFSPAANRTVTQSADVIFPTATDSWGTIQYWAIYDAVTGGNMLAYGAFSSSFAIVLGNTLTVGSGEVAISLDASVGAGFSDYLAGKLLDLMFNATAYTQPDTYLALTSVTIADSDTTITEQVGTGYARSLVDKNGGTSPAWGAVADGATTTDTDVSWSVGGSDWSEIVSLAIMDASTSGNLLMYDNSNVTDQIPGDGDTVTFNAGDVDVSLG